MPSDFSNMDAADVSMISLSFDFPPPLQLPLASCGRRKASRIDLSSLSGPSSSSASSGALFDWHQGLVVEEPQKPSFGALPLDIHHTIAVCCGPKWAALLAQTSRQMREVVEHAQRSGDVVTPAPAHVDETLAWCSGSSERLRVAWSQGFPDDRRFTEEAAAVGDVKVREGLGIAKSQTISYVIICVTVQTSLIVGSPSDIHDSSRIMQMLKQARRDGCPFDWRACRAAAAGGHLEALEFLREHGCNWDYRTYQAAAEGGHLELLKWLTDQGCPASKGCCTTE